MKIKLLFLILCSAFVISNAYGQQETLVINQKISTEDQAKILDILKSFDPNSYSFHYGKTKVGKAVGLENVRLTDTKVKSGTDGKARVSLKRPTDSDDQHWLLARPSIHIPTLTINLFRSIPGKNELDHADKLDQLHQILSKYQ